MLEGDEDEGGSGVAVGWKATWGVSDVVSAAGRFCTVSSVEVVSVCSELACSGEADGSEAGDGSISLSEEMRWKGLNVGKSFVASGTLECVGHILRKPSMALFTVLLKA